MVLTGGGGADTYVLLSSGGQHFTITDFDPASDKLAFSSSNDAANTDRMVVTQVGDDVLLSFEDLDDPNGPPTEILLLDTLASEITSTDIFTDI